MKSFSEIRFDIVEVLTKDDPAGKWISDFMKSDAPQFAGKSEKKKKQMALAAYYAKQNESKEAEVEEPEEEEKKEESVLKKAKKKEVEEKDCSCDEELKGDQHKLDKNKNGKLDKHDFKLLRKEEVELDEAMTPQQKSDFDRMMAGAMSRAAYNAKWKKPLKSDAKVIYGKNVKEEADDLAEVNKDTLDRYVTKAVDSHGHADFSARMSKDDPSLRSYHKDQKRTAEKRRQGISRALDRMSKKSVGEGWDEMMKAVKDKAKPQPNGGSGKKQGSRYGGTKQKDEPVKEAVQTPEQELERLKLRQDAEHGKAPLKRQAETQARIRELQKQVKEGLKPEHNLRPGWMLKKDPELAKKIEAKTKAYKALAKYAGKKIEKKD